MVSRTGRHRGQWAAVIAVMLCVLLPAAPAAAHNSLTGSNPADGARLDEPPAQVRLTFLSRLDPTTTKVTVTGPDNAPAAGGAPRFDGSRVTVPFTPGPAGQYTVAYQVASGDGHPVKGDVQFTLTTGAAPAPADPTPSAADPATSPAEAGTSPAGTPSATAVAGPLDRTSDDGGTGWWPWLVGAVLALAALVGAALLLRARRRPT